MNIRLPHATITRAPGLLPMQYTLVELAAELGLCARTLRQWVSTANLSLPHHRDARGHIWVEGRAFAAWVEANRTAKHKRQLKLAPGQAYCVSCRAVVTPANLQLHNTQSRIVLRGTCPICNKQVNRVVSWRQPLSKEMSEGHL